MNIVLDDIDSLLQDLDLPKSKMTFDISDEHRIESLKELIDIINPNFENGPWIAGGVALRLYKNQPLDHTYTDVDVFFSDQKSFELMEKTLASYSKKDKILCFELEAKTENAITFSILSNNLPTLRVQLIKKMFFKNLDEVLDNFDISICKIGLLSAPGTASHESSFYILNQNVQSDIDNNEFGFNEGQESVIRMLKYLTYGYNLKESDRHRIMENYDAIVERDKNRLNDLDY